MSKPRAWKQFEALRLLSRYFDEDMLRLFRHVLASSFFRFNGQFYEQTDGVSKGSPLSPVIADFFMEYFEETALERAIHKPLCWFRYVDDTFVICPHDPGKLSEFLDHLNSIHESIRFTMETERDVHLPFLDIDIHRKPDGLLDHKVYRKPTHTNLHLNSHHHPSNKHAVLSTLVHRARSLCDQESLHGGLEFLRTTFRQNGYSDRQIRRALNPPARRIQKPRAAQFLGEPIQWVETARYLGVTLDTQLTWSAHVNQVGKEAAQRLGVLGPSFTGEAACPLETVCC
jgi:hypothetical protein